MADPIQTILSARSYIARNVFSAEAYYHLVEALFFLLVIYLAISRAYKPRSANPSPSTKIPDWSPQPLAEPLPQDILDAQPLDITIQAGGAGPLLTVNGQEEVLNFCTNNFLGLLKHPEVADVAHATMKDYGLGACGPRGFYGTTDVHLACEQRLAEFCGTPNAILYSFGAATGNSTIPAFCKRGDLVVVDSALNYTLELGVQLSRAQVRRFKHNDMEDLESILKDVTMQDGKDPSLRQKQRRIIIVEGIYQNVGDVCPLDHVVRLKDKYLFRVMVDESFSLGVLGKSGRGALEHFGIPREAVEIATADLGNAVSSVGGFCVGNDEVVSHQRLSGAGYCFSASQPPFLAAAASTALGVIMESGSSLVSRLRENIATFRENLDTGALRHAGWFVDGDLVSPLMHIRSYDDTLPLTTFTEVQEKCLRRGVLIARPVYSASEISPQKPCVRVTVSASHSTNMIERAARVVREVLLEVQR